MIFSSPLFLFWFLPVVLAGHRLLPWLPARNAWLLVASLLFYGWGEPAHLPVMLVTVLGNFAVGRALGATTSPRLRAGLLALGVGGDLLLLVRYKYATFLAATLAGGGLPIPVPDPVPLPVGISFYVFQCLSYLVDVYRGDAAAERSPLRLALYVSLFPQLIAGPIVRYRDVAAQLAAREAGLADFGAGAERFIVGLAKKALLADPLAATADACFALPAYRLTTTLAWSGLLAFSLQIYFDFSGYSDMAIGLGRMLGFRFRENFDRPYLAASVRDFWRRWHISLSNFFRDYLYVPLGGNRGGAVRTGIHLLLVFALCGLWHGASWSFLVWGLWHGAFLCLERTRFGEGLERAPRPLAHAYTLGVVALGWVVFRAPDLAAAKAYALALVGLAPSAPDLMPPLMPDARLFWICAGAGIAACLPWHDRAAERGEGGGAIPRPVPGSDLSGPGAWVRAVGLLGIYVLAAAEVAGGAYESFIYYRF